MMKKAVEFIAIGIGVQATIIMNQGANSAELYMHVVSLWLGIYVSMRVFLSALKQVKAGF